MTKSFRGIYV